MQVLYVCKYLDFSAFSYLMGILKVVPLHCQLGHRLGEKTIQARVHTTLLTHCTTHTVMQDLSYKIVILH